MIAETLLAIAQARVSAAFVFVGAILGALLLSVVFAFGWWLGSRVGYQDGLTAQRRGARGPVPGGAA